MLYSINSVIFILVDKNYKGDVHFKVNFFFGYNSFFPINLKKGLWFSY